MQKLNLKKFFLYLFIASVSISAVLGISVILLGNFGEIETKVLLTTFTITCISILGLACGANLEAKRGKLLPISGIGLSILSAILWLILIWFENSLGDILIRFLMSVTILAVALSHISLVSLAKLDNKFRWAIIGIYISVGLLVTILLGLIWGEGTFESDFVMRILGVLSIIVAALTILIPILHKLSDNLNEESLIDAEIEKLKIRLSELEKRKEKISNNP
jgi:hypothetical protein